MRYVGAILYALLLASCDLPSANEASAPSLEECRQRLAAYLAAEFPAGVDPDSAREVSLDSAIVYYLEKRSPEPDPSEIVPSEPPRLLNEQELQKFMTAHYPRDLLSRGLGGTTQMIFFVRPDSVAEKARVARSSGYQEFDDASIRVVERARFSPGIYEGCPVWSMVIMPVRWVALPRPS